MPITGMFARSRMLSRRLHNLSGCDFETLVLRLPASNPYQASLPMLISAKLGSKHAYLDTTQRMIQLLHELHAQPDHFEAWMRNSSFKAWMWARVLSAADTSDIHEYRMLAEQELSRLLGKNKPGEQEYNLAFTTWAWGYRATLDKASYCLSKGDMAYGARKLSERAIQSSKHLPDALWSHVLNMYAAAQAGDLSTYHQTQRHIIDTVQQAITTELDAQQASAPYTPKYLYAAGILSHRYKRDRLPVNTVADALAKGLSRTSTSNDYPAWAMAIAYKAAAIAGDKALLEELKEPLETSIEEASEAIGDTATAEYALAQLDYDSARSILGPHPQRLAG